MTELLEHEWSAWAWPPEHGWGYDANCSCGKKASAKDWSELSEVMHDHLEEERLEEERLEEEQAHS